MNSSALKNRHVLLVLLIFQDCHGPCVVKSAQALQLFREGNMSAPMWQRTDQQSHHGQSIKSGKKGVWIKPQAEINDMESTWKNGFVDQALPPLEIMDSAYGHTRLAESGIVNATEPPLTLHGRRFLEGEGRWTVGWALAAYFVLLSMFGYFQLYPRRHNETGPVLTQQTLQQNVYGGAICSVVRDLQQMCKGCEDPTDLFYNALQMVLSVGLLALTIFLQMYLVYQILQLVTPVPVAKIRTVYSEYQQIMYSNHTYLTVIGEHRGYPGYFNSSLFNTVNETSKADICSIPFSQEKFFLIILFVWSLSCVREVRESVDMMSQLLIKCPTISSMASCLSSDYSKSMDNSNEVCIVGLTLHIKMGILFLLLLPRVCITGYLLWLGSRWLAATTNFGENVLNAVALEFILLLKELVFHGLAPDRLKQDLADTMVNPPMRRPLVNLNAYMGTLVWVMTAFVWSLLYMYEFQFVLRDYNFDVRDVCRNWLERNYKPVFSS